MKPILLVCAALLALPIAAAGQTGAPVAGDPAITPGPELAQGAEPAEAAAPVLPGPVLAQDTALDSQRFVTRPLVVFADTPEDPNFHRQVQLLTQGAQDLAARDVLVVLDTDPAGMSEWRRHLRPRGFSLVQLDKDLTPVFRKPMPWSTREIARAIDKLPTRRQEVAERFPGR